MALKSFKCDLPFTEVTLCWEMLMWQGIRWEIISLSCSEVHFQPLSKFSPAISPPPFPITAEYFFPPSSLNMYSLLTSVFLHSVSSSLFLCESQFPPTHLRPWIRKSTSSKASLWHAAFQRPATSSGKISLPPTRAHTQLNRLCDHRNLHILCIPEASHLPVCARLGV